MKDEAILTPSVIDITKEEDNTKGEIVIIAPHPDDEIIGCWEILQKNLRPIIIYSAEIEKSRRQEIKKLREYVNIKVQLFLMSIPTTFLNPYVTIYCPDPIYEIHPEHRKWGAVGESLVRNGINVIFYNTTMNAPYIHEVEESDKKEDLLNKVYPSQKNLWQYEKKYILFEGRNQWIMN